MPPDPAILSIGKANPSHRYTQLEIYEMLARISPFYKKEGIKQIFMNSDIDHRHLALDMTSFHGIESRDEMHERFRRESIKISSTAIRSCVESAQIDIGEIDFIAAVSCTGYLCPGLSSLLIKELDMGRNLQRADLLGMGCAGAMPGLQRAYDFVKAYPKKKALVLTVEICSACYYIDESFDTIVGNAICADGAAAIIVGMSDNPSTPKIVGFETLLEPAYIDSVGFEQRDGRWRIILSKDLRTAAGGLAGKVIRKLLEDHRLTTDRITHWILHSGGRKVIESIQKELSLSDIQVRHSRCVLQNFGNMSSPTVLYVLDETLREGNPQSGDLGVMLAMGPGLALEAALVRW